VSTSNTDLQIHYSTFLENEATAFDGGALRVGVQANEQPCVIAFSHFKRNEAARDGGTIFAIGDRTDGGRRLQLQLHHDEFEGNVAGGFGGSVATSGGVSVFAKECSFHASSDKVRAGHCCVGVHCPPIIARTHACLTHPRTRAVRHGARGCCVHQHRRGFRRLQRHVHGGCGRHAVR
jgi:hypothetical protein